MAGRWDAVPDGDWPSGLIAIHMIHLHTARVLIFAYGESHTGPPTVYHTHGAYEWDPTARTWNLVENSETNLFCSGHAGLEDGNVFVAGGQIVSRVGLDHANIFDPDTPGWSRVADMQYARWYPTCTTLPDGRQFTSAGSQFLDGVGDPVFATIPEVYLPDKDVWSELPDADLASFEYYPYMFVMPNGNLFFAGDDIDTRKLDLVLLSWSTPYTSPEAGGQAGSAVIYGSKVMKCGGAFGGVETTATAVIDLDDLASGWASVKKLNYKRRDFDLVLLPDGTTLAFGGKVKKESEYVPVNAVELFDPGASGDTWQDLEPGGDDPRPRIQHSTALLLPDATVLVAGGDSDGGQRNADIFSPPYLDESPTRCIIQSAPSGIDYEDTFNVIVDKNGGSVVDKVSLLRLGAVTHSFDQNQRFIDLDFTTGPGPGSGTETLTVTPPANANEAPPGYYMLFVLTTQSGVLVPCEMAKYIRISDGLVHVYPESIDVTKGEVESGVYSDLWQSDNQYVKIKDAGGPFPTPRFQIEVGATSPLPSNQVAEVTIKLEASCTLQGDQKIELYNYSTDDWVELLPTGTATTADSVVERTVDLNAGNYVKSADREMKARISWLGAGPGPNAKVDEIHWALKQTPPTP